MLRFAAALASAVLATGAAAAVEIDAIEAKVFLTESGTFSENVAEGTGVNLWNTVIGEGDIREPANDTLVIVTLAGAPGTYDEGTLAIEITGHDGKPVASRKIEGVLFGESGKVSHAVYLLHSTCNQLTVKASFGKSSKTGGVPFACGE